MARLKYSAAAVKHSFWCSEFRIIVDRMIDGFTDEHIKQQVMESNLLNASTPARRKDTYSTVYMRIHSLPEELLQIVQNSDLSTIKLINLIAIMRTNLLFFEFMNEVYKEKLYMQYYVISDMDLRVFFSNKVLEHSEISHWTDGTVKRLAGTYKTYLHESGLMGEGKIERDLNPPIIDPILSSVLASNNMQEYLNILTGTR